jgi:hypothetical protein
MTDPSGMRFGLGGFRSVRNPIGVCRGTQVDAKHRASPYWRNGVVVSRAPHGGIAGGQLILDLSEPNGSRHRLGIEPDTGLIVQLRLHFVNPATNTEYFHGFVPGGT